MARGDMLRLLRTALRFLQFAFALVALATVARAFVGASYYGYSSMLGSRAATYTLLITYTSMLVGLFLFLFVELLRYWGRPAPRFVEQLIDLILAAMFVVAGIVLVVSDYVAHCSVYGFMLRCNMLKTGVVFTFLAAAAHLASFLVAEPTIVPKIARASRAVRLECDLCQQSPARSHKLIYSLCYFLRVSPNSFVVNQCTRKVL